jgi:hypothetical protein
MSNLNIIVSPSNAQIFNTTKIGDVLFYTGSNSQSYHFGTSNSNVPYLTMTSNVTYFNRNIGIGLSNPVYPLHVIGDVYATGDVIAFSDSNVKYDLIKIEGAMDKLKNITGYTFARRDLVGGGQVTNKRFAGLLAQDVQKVLPEVVYKDGNDMMSIAYGNMAALFVECIKDLQTQIDDIKMKINV